MTEPQLRLLQPPEIADLAAAPTVGCFDLVDLSTRIAGAIDDVEAAINVERSRFRTLQLLRVQVTLQDLYMVVDSGMHAIRE